MKKFALMLSSAFAGCMYRVAYANVEACCWLWTYQPKMPEKLRKASKN